MTAPRFFHAAHIVILLAWSGVMLYFYGSGRVNHILTENFRIAPLLGGLGLAVVAFFNLFTGRSAACCGHDHIHDLTGPGAFTEGDEKSETGTHKPDCCGHGHHHEHHHAHGHEHDHSHEHDHEHAHDHEHSHAHAHEHEHHHEHGLAPAAPRQDGIAEHAHAHDDQTVSGILVTLLIALVPAIGGAALSEDKFSVQTLAHKGLYSNEVNAPAGSIPPPPKDQGNDGASANEDRYTLADLEKQVRKSEDGNFLIPIPSLFYSAADEELAEVLRGQPIETTGQVAPEIAENDPEGNRLRLYRLFISCCLADARPIGFSADFGKSPPELPEDSWVKIIGSMSYPEQDGRKVPVLDVDSIEVIPEPQDQMY